MFSLAAVVVVAMVACCQAFPQGAPSLQFGMAMDSMCTTGNLRPNHTLRGEPMPQFQNPPYKLRVENAHIPYKPGRQVKVTLMADPGRTFKGFFITGDGMDAKAGFRGTWQPAMGTQAKLTMFCVPGITHVNSNNKTSVSVIWSPPPQFTYGTVQFKATVVESYEVFFTGILSNSIKADSTVDTQTSFAQKQFQQMQRGLGMFNNGNQGQGGNANLQEMMRKMRAMMGNQNQQSRANPAPPAMPGGMFPQGFNMQG